MNQEEKKKIWGFIYVYTIKDKKYVGQAINLKDRHKQHLKEKSNPYFHNSLRKYFKCGCFQIIEAFYNYPKPLRGILNNQEIYWIKYFNCYDPTQTKGWNLTKGGNGSLGLKHTTETKQKQREVKLGKKMPNTSGEKHYNFGKHLSEERKQRQKISMFGKKFPEHSEQMKGEKHFNAKKVILISPDGIEFILPCYRPFCEESGLDASSMRKVLIGKRPQHKGWRGKYYEEK